MKKLVFFTAARSDFGPILPILRHASRIAQVDILVGGAHFAPSRGSSLAEVERETEGLPVRRIPVEFLLEGESPAAQAKSVALGQLSIAQWFATHAYDAVVLLGDRWELFAASVPALLFNLPIAHISGGEVTQGVIDDAIRHAHSKLAHLHFVATRAYAQTLSLMGEEDWRITVSGECGLDSIHLNDLATPEEIRQRFGVDLQARNLLVTYHPSTREPGIPAEAQVDGLLQALERFSHLGIILTAPGVEQGADLVQARLVAFAETHPGARFIPHFGRRNYLAVMQAAAAVVGNSSSGIVEAPSFGVPTVDIGARQRDRLAAPSVLHTDYTPDAIAEAIGKAVSEPFQAFSRQCGNPYDPYRDGRNSERIVYALAKALEEIPPASLVAKRFEQDVKPEAWSTLLGGFQ